MTFDEGLVVLERPEEMVALDDALDELARVDERKLKIIEMCYLHVATGARQLRLAQAWLDRRLRR